MLFDYVRLALLYAHVYSDLPFCPFSQERRYLQIVSIVSNVDAAADRLNNMRLFLCGCSRRKRALPLRRRIARLSLMTVAVSVRRDFFFRHCVTDDLRVDVV